LEGQTVLNNELSRFERAVLAALLGRMMGADIVQPSNRDDRKLLKKATELGLVGGNGTLTMQGAAFIDDWASGWSTMTQTNSA
jgi:hypothetical protein